MAAGELRAMVSASSWAASRNRSGGSTTCDTIPSSYARGADIRSWRPSSAMRMTASNGSFRASPMASIAVTWPTDTCGSTNCASLAASTMSASATKWSPPPAQMPFTAVITGFCTCWCQAVKWRSHSTTESR